MLIYIIQYNTDVGLSSPLFNTNIILYYFIGPFSEMAECSSFVISELSREGAVLIRSHGCILYSRPCPSYKCSSEMPHMYKFDKQEVSDCKSCPWTAGADISGGHTNEPAGRPEERGER